jgi:homoserine dehydrogenase
VLKKAQAAGYAEADPSADVDGFDARAKLCVLARLALHAEIDPERFRRRRLRRFRRLTLRMRRSWAARCGRWRRRR